MRFLTWNLGRGERAFRLALSHLAGLSGEFVAALQELPPSASSTAKARRLSGSLTQNRVKCLNVMGSTRAPGRLGLFTSRELSATDFKQDGNQRMGMMALKSKRWSELYVVGVHAVDRRNVSSEYARGTLAGLSRLEIEAFWKPNRPLVVMGDFNADPYHPEVSGRLGLFAVRDRREAHRDWESTLVAGPMRPLYNPMWRLLPENPSGPGGTFVLNSGDQGIRWRLCDQILVSRELMDKLDGPPQILSMLVGTKLTTAAGNPSGRISDHLPVHLSVKM